MGSGVSVSLTVGETLGETVGVYAYGGKNVPGRRVVALRICRKVWLGFFLGTKVRLFFVWVRRLRELCEIVGVNVK